jgi:cytochrome b561
LHPLAGVSVNHRRLLRHGVQRFFRADRPVINMIHVSCGISVLVLMVTRCWFA